MPDEETEGEYPELVESKKVYGGRLYGNRWYVQEGQAPSGSKAITVTDMRPEEDDRTETEFVFVWHSGLATLTTVNSHDHSAPREEEWDCVELDPKQVEVPGQVTELVAKLWDAPVILPKPDGHEEVER